MERLTTPSPLVPESLIATYRNAEGNSYMEIASMVRTREGYKAGAFSPMKDNFLTKFTAEVMAAKSSIRYNAFEDKNVLFFRETMNTRHVVWLVPAKKRPLFFMTDNIENGEYPVPSLIFSVADKSLSVFAVKDAVLTADTALYKAPFPNINSGNVCMGNVSVKKNPDRKVWMKNWETGFFNSNFTHTSENQLIDGNLITLMHQIKDTEVFPDQILLKTKLTLNSLFRD
jgi:PRTRC genetic system protein B